MSQIHNIRSAAPLDWPGADPTYVNNRIRHCIDSRDVGLRWPFPEPPWLMCEGCYTCKIGTVLLELFVRSPCLIVASAPHVFVLASASGTKCACVALCCGSSHLRRPWRQAAQSHLDCGNHGIIQ